jgi:hypothetical protein
VRMILATTLVLATIVSAAQAAPLLVPRAVQRAISVSRRGLCALDCSRRQLDPPEHLQKDLDALARFHAVNQSNKAAQRSATDPYLIASPKPRGRWRWLRSRACSPSITASGTRAGCSPAMMSFITPGDHLMRCHCSSTATNK